MDTHNTPLTMSLADVAGALGCSPRTFQNRRSRLEQEHGFPPRLPAMARWSRPAVEAWIASNGETFRAAGAEADHVATAAAALEDRYAGGHGA